MQSHLHQFHQSLHPEPPPPQQQQQQQQQQHQQQQQQPQNHHHHTHQPPQLPYQHNDSSLQQHEQSLKLHLPVHQDHQDHYSQQQQQFHSHHSQFLLPHSTQQPQEHQPQQGQQSLSDHHFHHQLNQRQQPLHSHQPHQIQGQDHLLPQHQPGQHSPDRPQPQQLLQHRLQYSPRIGEQPAHQHYANSAITSSGAVAGGTMDVFHPATHSRPLQFSLSTDSNPDPFHPYPNTPFVAHAPPSTSSTSVVSSVNQLPARNSFPVASSALQSSPGETGTSYQSLGPTPRFHHQNDRQQQQEQQQQQQQQQPQQEQISLFPSVSQASQGGSSSNDAIWSYAGARPAPNEYSQGQVQSLDPSNSAVLLMSYSPHQQPQRAQQGQLPTALSISFDQTPEQTHFPGGSGPRNHSPSPASPSASPTEYTGPNAGSGADSFYGNRFLATDQDIPASGIGSLANSAGAAGDGANLAEDGGGLQPSGSQARSSSRSQITKRWSCEFCRQRKVKCDGKKPSCSFCIRKNSKCIYLGLPRKHRSANASNSTHSVSTGGNIGSINPSSSILQPLPSSHDFGPSKQQDGDSAFGTTHFSPYHALPGPPHPEYPDSQYHPHPPPARPFKPTPSSPPLSSAPAISASAATALADTSSGTATGTPLTISTPSAVFVSRSGRPMSTPSPNRATAAATALVRSSSRERMEELKLDGQQNNLQQHSAERAPIFEVGSEERWFHPSHSTTNVLQLLHSYRTNVHYFFVEIVHPSSLMSATAFAALEPSVKAAVCAAGALFLHDPTRVWYVRCALGLAMTQIETPNLATFQALVMLFQCCRETPDLNTAAAVLAIANQVAISLNVNHPSGPWMHPCITSQLDLEIAGRCWWSCYVANTSCPVMGTDPFPDIRMKPVCPEAEWLSLVPGTPVVRSSVFREMLYQNENPFNFLMSICQILNRIFRLRSLARDPTGGSANAGPSGMAKTSANSSVNDEFCRLEDQLVEWIRMLPSHLWLPIPDEAYVLSAEGDLSVGGANMLAPFFDDSEDEVEVAAGRGSTLVSPSSALSGTPPWCVLTLNFVYFACVSALHLERLYAAVRSIPSSPSSLPSNYGPGLAFPSSSDSAYSTSSPSNIVDTNKPESRLSPAHSPRLAAEPNAPRPSLNSYSAVAALRNSSMSSAGSPISAATVGGSPNPVHSMTPAGITRVIWNVGRAPGRSRIQFEKSLTILRSSCKSISILNLYLVRFLRRRGLLGPSFGSVTGTSGMEISPGSLKNPLTATPPTSATISPTTTLSALPSLTAHGSGTAKPAFVAAPTPAVLCPRLFGWSLFIGTLSTAAITLASLGPPPPPSQPPPPQSSTSSMAATSPSTVSRDTLLKLLLSNVDLLVLSDPAMSAILHPLLAHIQDRVGAGSFMVPLTAPAAAAACPPTPQSPVWVPGASVDMRRALEACVARVKVEAASIPVRNGVWPGKIEIEVRQLLSVFTGSA